MKLAKQPDAAPSSCCNYLHLFRHHSLLHDIVHKEKAARGAIEDRLVHLVQTHSQNAQKYQIRRDTHCSHVNVTCPSLGSRRFFVLADVSHLTRSQELLAQEKAERHKHHASTEERAAASFRRHLSERDGLSQALSCLGDTHLSICGTFVDVPTNSAGSSTFSNIDEYGNLVVGRYLSPNRLSESDSRKFETTKSGAVTSKYCLDSVGLTSLNFWTTILNLRSYYLILKTIPLFPFSFLITAFVLLFTLPILSGTLLLMLGDLHSTTLFFDPIFGGDPIFYQHLFWLFGLVLLL